MRASTDPHASLDSVKPGLAIAVAVLALFGAIQVVRQAAVSAGTSGTAAALWPGHPEVVFHSAMERIGQRAAAGRPPDEVDVQLILSTARKAPLAPEPFLVRGVSAQVAGKEMVAGTAFIEAQRRDPRSLPARYFLASYYERAGNVRQGLEQISALLRMVPTGVQAVAPQLAEYARRPEARPAIRSLLQAHPELEPAILGTLAQDARNADLILALAAGAGGTPARRDWQARLVSSLVADGQYDKAHALWRAFARIPAEAITRSPIFNAEFAKGPAPAPFNWSLASSAAGVAEYARDGGLHVVHYGREPATLATQVILLKPGRYRLAMTAPGSAEGAKGLAWKLVCLPDRKQLLQLTLDGPRDRPFEVPSSACRAQQIELVGSLEEIPQTADVTISRLAIAEIGE